MNHEKQIIVVFAIIAIFIQLTTASAENFNKSKYMKSMHELNYYFMNSRNISDYEINSLISAITPKLMFPEFRKKTTITLSNKICPNSCNYNNMYLLGVSKITQRYEIIHPEKIKFKGENWTEEFNTKNYSNMLFGEIKSSARIEYYKNQKILDITLINTKSKVEHYKIMIIYNNTSLKQINETIKPYEILINHLTINQSATVKIRSNRTIITNYSIKINAVKLNNKPNNDFQPTINVSLQKTNFIIKEIIDAKISIINNDSINTYKITVSFDSPNLITKTITKEVHLLPLQQTQIHIPIMFSLEKNNPPMKSATLFQQIINYDMRNLNHNAFLDLLKLNINVESNNFKYHKTIEVPVYNIYTETSNTFDYVIIIAALLLTAFYMILIFYKRKKVYK